MKWNDLSLADVRAIVDVAQAVEAGVDELRLVDAAAFSGARISMMPGKPVMITLPELVFPEIEGLCTGACTDTVLQVQEAFEAEAERMASVRGLAQRMAAPTAPEPVGEAEALRQTAAWMVTPSADDGEAVDYDAPCEACQGACTRCGAPLADDSDDLFCLACAAEAEDEARALGILPPLDMTDGTEDDPFLVAPASPTETVIVAEGPATAAAAEAVTCDTAETLGRPAPWSEADDQTAIWMAANGHRPEDIAARVGRPVEGTKFRLKNKLRDRIAEARAQIEAAGQPAQPDEPGAITTEDPAQEALPEEAASGAAAEPEPPEAGGGSPTPGAPAGIDPDLWAHIQAVPRGKIWTLKRDTDLLDLAVLGWPIEEIASEIRVVAKELKPRFEVLTDGKRWKRADVLAALQLLGALAQAAE